MIKLTLLIAVAIITIGCESNAKLNSERFIKKHNLSVECRENFGGDIRCDGLTSTNVPIVFDCFNSGCYIHD